MARRFYGGEHRKLRAEWLPLVNAGSVICPRCNRFIQSGGEPCTKCGKPMRSNGFASDGYCGWDLGHVDGGADTDYTGPEHSCCSRATTAHRKQRRQQPRNGNRVTRRWL